jgi:Spy/CpxP family protein refolding chaperone
VKKSKLWIILSLILIFAAGVGGGIFAERWWLAKKPEARRGINAARYPSHDRWAKELGLTAEQQEKIREIFKKNDERIKGLRTDYFKHVGEMRDELKKEIDAVLTPAQKQKMEAMIQKFSEERRRDNEKREKQNESQRNRNLKKESNNEKKGDRRSGDPGGSLWSHPGLYPF